ncbi:MAG: hypothetical protein KDE19_04095, partial [Caldilineaceae bacterium]|nr:hypothetical protein [Caldilineaceae bacterium]
LWVLDRATRSLLHVAPDDELLDTIALPVTQELEHAQLLVTQKGELLLSAPADARILRLNPAGEVIERWFGFSSPTALALASDGRLFVADPTVDQIGILPPRRASIPAVALPEILTPEGQPISPLSPLLTPAETITDESQAATFRRIGAGALKQPLGVAVNANGQLYVADPDRSELAIFAPDGALLHQITEGSGPLDRPNDVTIDQAGNVLLLDSGRGEIIVFNSEGVYLRTLVADIDLLGDARGLGAGSDGSVWVASTRRGHIIQIGSDGQVILEYPSTPADDGQPVDVAVDGEGRIYLVEASTLQLVQLSRLGIRRNSWSLQGFNTGNAPHLAIDSNDALYITAPEQGIVTKFDEQGRVLASWQLPRPADVAVKPIGIDVDAQGNIYVASVEQGIVIAIAPQ